jgi:hypothetical protein
MAVWLIGRAPFCPLRIKEPQSVAAKPKMTMDILHRDGASSARQRQINLPMR